MKDFNSCVIRLLQSITYKCMHDIIIKSGVINKHISNSSNVIVQTFIQTIKYAIMSTEITQDALKSSIIPGPNVTMFIQIKFKSFSGFIPKRVKVLSTGVNVHRYPMLSRAIMWVRVTHQ